MGRSGFLCSRCGGTEQRDVGPRERECVDCGLRSTWAPLVTSSRPATPDPAVVAQMHQRWREMAATFAAAPFRPFALDGRWTGSRYFGGHGGSGGGTDSLTLAFGPPPGDDAARVRIETRIPQQVGLAGPRDPALQRVTSVHHLLREYSHEFGDLPDGIRAAAYPLDAPVHRHPAAPWPDATITLDGTPVTGKVLARDQSWFGLFEHDGFFVSITAHRWPIEATGLVRETDFEVYVVGAIAVTDEMRRRRS